MDIAILTRRPFSFIDLGVLLVSIIHKQKTKIAYLKQDKSSMVVPMVCPHCIAIYSTALDIFIFSNFSHKLKLVNRAFESSFQLLWLLYYQIPLQTLIQITSHLCHDKNQQLSSHAPFTVPSWFQIYDQKSTGMAFHLSVSIIPGVSKKYTKLIKHNFKLMTSVNDM